MQRGVLCDSGSQPSFSQKFSSFTWIHWCVTGQWNLVWNRLKIVVVMWSYHEGVSGEKRLSRGWESQPGLVTWFTALGQENGRQAIKRSWELQYSSMSWDHIWQLPREISDRMNVFWCRSFHVSMKKRTSDALELERWMNLQACTPPSSRLPIRRRVSLRLDAMFGLWQGHTHIVFKTRPDLSCHCSGLVATLQLKHGTLYRR